MQCDITSTSNKSVQSITHPSQKPQIKQPRCQLIIHASLVLDSCRLPACLQHLRYCLRDGTGNPSTEEVDVGFQDEDIGVVWGRTSQQLWEVFQAKTLQGAIGEEWETWKIRKGGRYKVKLMQHVEHCSQLYWMDLKQRLVYESLCKITSTVTCIRGHSNKCWGKAPVEAQNAPLL